MVAVVKKTTLTPNDVAVDDSNKTADLLGGPESKSVIVNDANDRMLPPNFGFVSRQAGWKNEQPTERYHAISITNPYCDSNTWVIFGNNSQSQHSSLREYETTSYKWCARKMTGSMPTTSFSHNYAVYKGNLYVWGGHGKRGFVGSLYQMNCKSLEWKCLDSFMKGTPPNYISAASCGYDNEMCCFGGKSPTGKLSSDVYILNLETYVWSILNVEKDPFYDDSQQCLHRRSRSHYWYARPIARHSTSLECINGVIYMFGGVDVVGSQVPTNELESPNVVFKLSLENCRWTAISCTGEPPPMKIYGHATFSLKGLLFCVGGFRSPHVHVLDPSNSIWVVPNAVGTSCKEGNETPMRLREMAQILTPAESGKHKGEIWAECRITRIRSDGLHDVHISPTHGSDHRGAMTGVPRSRLRKTLTSLFPPRCHLIALPLESSNRFIVFGGIQIENNKILQDTHLISVVPQHCKSPP